MNLKVKNNKSIYQNMLSLSIFEQSTKFALDNPVLAGYANRLRKIQLAYREMTKQPEKI